VINRLSREQAIIGSINLGDSLKKKVMEKSKKKNQ